MPRDTTFHDYVVHDLLATMPGITSRAMFGGWGIYRDEKIFAIIVEGELYFKVDDTNRADFEKFGSDRSHAFVYAKVGGKTATMSYWLVPEEVMEDREKLFDFVDKAVAVSVGRK